MSWLREAFNNEAIVAGAPDNNASPQPCVATPETEVANDNKQPTNSGAVETEEEDPLRLLGSKTVCVTNRRHRLLPLHQEPSTELLRPIYTDQSRRPGQTHCFPEIAALVPKNAKRKRVKKRKERTSNDDDGGIDRSPGKKCGGKNAGKRKSGLSCRSKSPRRGNARKRRRKDSVEESERDVDIACLKEPTRGRSAVVSVAASSLSCQKSPHEINTYLKKHGNVLDVNDNDVSDASGVRSQAIQSCRTANKGCLDVQLCERSLQTRHNDTDRSRGDRDGHASGGTRSGGTHVDGSEGGRDKRLTKRLSVSLAPSAVEAWKASASHMQTKRQSATQRTSASDTQTKRRSATQRNSITIDVECASGVSRAHRRESSAREQRPSSVVKESVVARRRSVRLQHSELHNSHCNTSNDARQSHGRANQPTTDLSVSHLSDVNQSTATQISQTSSMHQHSRLLNLTATSRKSIDEFAVESARRVAEKIQNRETPRNPDTSGNNLSAANVSRTVSVSINCSRNNRSDAGHPSTSRQSGLSSCGRRNSSGGNVCDTSHWKKVMISENRKSHDLPCKTLVMTSLHTE